MSTDRILRDEHNELINATESVSYSDIRKNKHPIFYLGKGLEDIEYCDRLQNLTLIAGNTGSGKSLFLETFVLDLANRYTPDELSFILIDSKKVQFPHFSNLPHLICPIITDASNSRYILEWLLTEMNRRYRLLVENKLNHSEQFWDMKVGVKLPHIVLVVDEFVELLIHEPEILEKKIIKLVKYCGSVGIHLVLSSQRPGNDVFTGPIKSHTDALLVFALADASGFTTFISPDEARNLNGKGDMLYKIDALAPIRIQAEYRDDNDIVGNLKNLATENKSGYDTDLVNTLINKNEDRSTDDPLVDILLEDAIELSVELGRVSAASFQRNFSIAYSRAARIIDAIEELGLVELQDRTKQRIIIMEKYLKWREKNNIKN